MRKAKMKRMIREEFARVYPATPPKIDLNQHIHPRVEPQKLRELPAYRRIVVGVMATVVIFLAFVALPWIPSLWPTTTTISTSTTTSSTTTTTDSSTTTTTDSSTTSSQTTSSTQITTTPDLGEVDEQIVATQIVTATKLAFSMSVSDALQLAYRLEEPIFLMDDYIAWVNRYVNALASALVDEGGYATVVLESDDERYTFLSRSQSVSFTGEIETYDLYYNVVADNDGKKELAGIVVWDETTSAFVGTLKEENGETKLSISAYETETLADDYVFTEFKINDTDQKYRMLVIEHGVTVLDSQIKFSVEEDQAKITVDIDDGLKTLHFDMKRETIGEATQLTVNYRIDTELDSENGRMTVSYDATEDEYVYELIVHNESKTYRQPRYRNDVDSNALLVTTV